MQESTSLPEATHASHSVLQGSAEAWKMTATSGRKCCELLHKQNPLGSFVKMFMVTSIWDSTMCLPIWKAKATPRNRLLFLLELSARPTSETECGWWPTPQAGANNKAAHGAMSGDYKTKYCLAAGIGTTSRLHPGPIELQMGYPEGWTELEDSETR